ncbi:transcriptional repressor NF-X1 isoform X1 [Hydra vulgaris]|nr:transcriptional repressor NF-X1 [Hydra vulgaris]
MASHRKSALYKPTDFASKNRTFSSTSTTENNMDDEKVVKKIQQRPLATNELAHIENNQSNNQQDINDKETVPVVSTQERPLGVAEKDAEKIKRLQEYMAKMSAATDFSDSNMDKKSESNKGVKDNNRKKSGNNNRYQKAPSNKSSNKLKNDQKPNDSTRVYKGPKKDNKGQKMQSQTKKIDEYQGFVGKYQEGSIGVNNYYSNQLIPGINGPNEMQWLPMQYAVAPTNQSILGSPYNSLPLSAFRSSKPDRIPQPTHNQLQMESVRDKSEHKKSLDFVKNFFNNDPEVQYNRKKMEERTGVIKTSATNTESLQLMQPGNQVSLGQQNHFFTNNQLPVQGQQQHIHSNLQTPNYHQSPVSHGAYVGSSGFRATANVLPTGSNMNYSGASIQQSSAPPGIHVASNAYGTQHIGSSPGRYSHSQISTLQQQHNQMSTLPQNHVSSVQQSINYQEMFPLQHGNALPPSTNVSAFYQQSFAHRGNPSGMSNYSQYANCFPNISHQSHVGYVKQEIDQTVVQTLLKQDHAMPEEWQQTALSKCGPMNSSQAQSLIEQLIKGVYECMICCDSVKWNHEVWNCGNCYHIFHLQCIKKWARSETAAVKDESGWRCPGCQNVSTRPPNKYFCFCGKIRDPDWNPRDGITPHSCGEICKKKRLVTCDHGCSELCHPGPCPSCPVMVTKHCPCTKTISKIRCGQIKPIICDNICSKLLKCGKHNCQLKCHEGACQVCEVEFAEGCFCGKEKRFVVCGTGEIVKDRQPDALDNYQGKYSCNKPCGREKKCAIHKCEAICHSGNCSDCLLLPKYVTLCPCGKVNIVDLLPKDVSRKFCTDDIPTCESFCGKKLPCGPKGSSHLCMQKCHTGKCRPCEKVSTVQCRCGVSKKEIFCKDIVPGEPILCERKCNKKRKCGRHKCNQKCCIDRDHTCNIICGKKLSCGIHKCDEVCHAGFCPPCWRAGFEELACFCGATILYPPIACGAKPPECSKPCTRNHPCGHPTQHTCHNEDVCPPCTVLTSKQCMGGHETWKNIPCHLVNVSCGRLCGKMLPCGLHHCIKKCHKDQCYETDEVCTQPCPVKRNDCTHSCNAPCHVGSECPSTPCKAQITIFCRCKRLSANALCLSGNVNSAYQSFNAEMLSGQLRNLQLGQYIDIAALTNAKRPKFLDCDEECSRIERNKRLAEALGIDNNEGLFQHAQYSTFLKEQAKVQYLFIQMLENLLENLIFRLKKSSQEQLHHPFPPMNLNQRKIIHELAEAYNCKTYSQDQEPNRNTVVVAAKDSFIPQVKLTALIEREFKQSPHQSSGVQTLSSTLSTSSMTHVPPIEKPNYFEDS